MSFIGLASKQVISTMLLHLLDIRFQRSLHDRPWISPCIKSISIELDITIPVIASQLSRYCDDISNRLWCRQQKKDHASETRNWPFVRSPVNSPGQWRGALMFSLICVWINGWVNNHVAGDLRRHRAHYDVIVMSMLFSRTFGILI